MFALGADVANGSAGGVPANGFAGYDIAGGGVPGEDTAGNGMAGNDEAGVEVLLPGVRPDETPDE